MLNVQLLKKRMLCLVVFMTSFASAGYVKTKSFKDVLPVASPQPAQRKTLHDLLRRGFDKLFPRRNREVRDVSVDGSNKQRRFKQKKQSPSVKR